MSSALAKTDPLCSAQHNGQLLASAKDIHWRKLANVLYLLRLELELGDVDGLLGKVEDESAQWLDGLIGGQRRQELVVLDVEADLRANRWSGE